MKGEQYKASDLEKVYINLCNKKHSQDPSALKDNLALISRMLVWDDQHQKDLFEYVISQHSYVCEVKMLQTMLQIFGAARDKEVVNAILGFFTILLSNLNRQPSVNYILSHGVIGCLTMAKFNNMNNQIADYYINFLKVLSRKITNNNLDLFYNERYPTFPIITQTIRFFNHPQSLVRTTSRNIILTIAKLKSNLVDHFMTDFPFNTYYVHESNFIKEYWVIIDNIIRSKQQNAYQLTHLQNLFQDHEEILIFIDDLLGLRQKGVVQAFMSAFVNQCISPLVRSLDTEAKQCFGIQLCLYIMIVLFKTFTHPFVVDVLALVVFGKYYTKQTAGALFQPVDCLLSYDKKWKFKGFWDSHEEKIRMHSAETYRRITQAKQKPQPQQQQNLMQSISNKMEKMDTKAIFGITNNFYERQIQKVYCTLLQVESIFGTSVLTKRQENSGVGWHLRSILTQLQTKELDIQQCEINSISNAIQSYLTSKDDCLVMLTLTLFRTIFQNKGISLSVLHSCKLSLQLKAKDFESVIKIEKLIINSIKIFSVDPPCFRMCTYTEASELAKHLSGFYQQNKLSLSNDVLSVLKTGLKTVIDRVSPYLFSGKQWENVMTMYLQVCRYYSKIRSKTLMTYGFLPVDQEINVTANKATDFVYNNYPREFQHQIVRDFWIYLLMKDLVVLFNDIYSFGKKQGSQIKAESYKYEEGRSYSSIEDERIAVEYRMSLNSKFSQSSIILMTNYFVLVTGNLVERRVNYDQLMPMVDKSDSRRMFLSGQGETIYLHLKEASTAHALLKHFEEGRSVTMRYRLSQLVKQIEFFRSYYE